MNATTWDIFLAHAGADGEIADHLYQLLSQNVRVFLDSRCLLLGDDWDRELTKAQHSSLITVVLVSERTGGAYYQREEIAAAIAMSRDESSQHRVVPIFLNSESRTSDAVPYGLRLKHGLTLTSKNDLHNAAKELSRLVANVADPRHQAQPRPSTSNLTSSECTIPQMLKIIQRRLVNSPSRRATLRELANDVSKSAGLDSASASSAVENLVHRQLLRKTTGARLEMTQYGLSILTEGTVK